METEDKTVGVILFVIALSIVIVALATDRTDESAIDSLTKDIGALNSGQRDNIAD